MGSQLGKTPPLSPGIGLQLLSHFAQPKHFASTNHFQPLASVVLDYQPLAYINIELGHQIQETQF